MEQALLDRAPTSPIDEVLRCDFVRGKKVITTEFGVSTTGLYHLALVPQWDPGASLVEWFDEVDDALNRQAEMAYDLRQAGFAATASPTRPRYYN